MRINEIKIGEEVNFPIETTEENVLVFKEILSRNRHLADLTTIVGVNGKEKYKLQEYIVRGGVKLISYEVKEADILLRARKTSSGLIIWGFRVTKVSRKQKKCFAEPFFVMYDGHFDGKEIQDNLYEAVLKLIERIQRFQFMF